MERLKPNGFGQNADLCDAKADIYISIIGLSVKRSPMKVAIKSTPSVLSLIVLKISL